MFLQREQHYQIEKIGYVELVWSNNLREKILQFNYQLTRTYNEKTLISLSIILREILTQLQLFLETSKIQVGEYIELMIVLYKMIGYTRDIITGKGEYILSFMMIHVWYDFFPELAKYALSCFVYPNGNFVEPNTKIHPYGSWKDIKYFCDFCLSQSQIKAENSNSRDKNLNLVQYSIFLINNQIRIDVNANQQQSLAAKWTPREKSSRFGWLFNELATKYYNNCNSKNAKTLYRKMISKLNNDLDTIQIKQCNGNWSDIVHSKTTSITISKQHKILLNTNIGIKKSNANKDRIICANNFKKEIDLNSKSDVIKSYIKGKRVPISYFVKQAIQIINFKEDEYNYQKKLLNSQWIDNSEQTNTLCPMIACVDTSLQEPILYNAIGFGIRIAEKSILGKRLITFNSIANWHNLENCNNFIEMVENIQFSISSLHNLEKISNFYSAMDKILDVIIEKKMTHEAVNGLSIIIFSSMQMDKSQNNLLYKEIENKYAIAGLIAHKKPYTLPHIHYWNMESTTEFPSLSTQKNVTMLSGYNTNLFNVFKAKNEEENVETNSKSLNNETCTPWSKFMQSLNTKRYKCMEEKIKQHCYLFN